MSKNLAIIGASYLQLPLIEKAKEMGYTTHVFAWKANDVGEGAADFFYPISIVEKDKILEECRKIDICGICSIASDLAIVTVNYIAEKMNLPGNTMESTQKSTNKHLMRMAFEKNNDPSPRSSLIDENADISALNFTYPIIVKPTDRSGSRGICKLDDDNGLNEAVKLAMEQSFEKKVLVEEFAEGKEYSVEYINYHGEHHFLALTEKITTGPPHFIETGHIEPADVEISILENVKKIVSHALDSLEIKNGAAHAEIKIADDGTIKIIEIGGRMGGDCIGSHLVMYSTGYDFVKMVIQVAVGEKPELIRTGTPIPVEVKFIITEKDIDELDQLKKYAPEQLIQIVDFCPERVGQMTDSSNRAGCYIKRL